MTALNLPSRRANVASLRAQATTDDERWICDEFVLLFDEIDKAHTALRFYRDQWTFHAIGDESDGVTDMGRLDGYEAVPTSALLKDGGDIARVTVSQGVIKAEAFL